MDFAGFVAGPHGRAVCFLPQLPIELIAKMSIMFTREWPSILHHSRMEETMQEQISEPLAQPLAPSSPPVKLWTPGVIAAIAFFLGFPSGIVLASINWMRMKMNNKALTHLIAGIIGTFIFVVLVILLPGNLGSILGLVTNIGVLLYLQREMKKDLVIFQSSSNTVGKANELGGCLIGLGILALLFIGVISLTFVFAVLGVPMPE
jgi:hypothetical protein